MPGVFGSLNGTRPLPHDGVRRFVVSSRSSSAASPATAGVKCAGTARVLVVCVGLALLVHLFGGLSESAPEPTGVETAAAGSGEQDTDDAVRIAGPTNKHSHSPADAGPGHLHEAECGVVIPQSGSRVVDVCPPNTGLLFTVAHAEPALIHLASQQCLPHTPEIVAELGIQRV